MTLPVFIPPRAPSAGLRNKPEVKVLKAEFGDGYTQTAGDGINNVRKVLSLTWSRLPATDALLILDFLEARKGYEPFIYAIAPGRPSIKFTCEEWADEEIEAGMITVTATFKQSFVL